MLEEFGIGIYDVYRQEWLTEKGLLLPEENKYYEH